jgi:hypothetical protein
VGRAEHYDTVSVELVNGKRSVNKINENWVLDPNGKAEDAWVDVICDFYQDGKCWTRASIKWDGCIHFHIAGNVPFSKDDGSVGSSFRDKAACDDYIHICNLKSFIEKLQKLEKFAKEYFRTEEEWSY